MTTPNVAQDVLDRVAELLPGTWDVETADRNGWAGPELASVPTGVPMNALFVLFVGERNLIHNDGQFRWFQVQCLIRGARDAWAATEVQARALYDAIHLSGPFTANGTAYLDLRATNAPAYAGQGDNGPHYFSVDVDAWFDG